MALTLYNTLTRRKEPFEPIEAGKVRMYCCGVTVYDYCHLGHARSYIVWDTVRRYLQWLGFQVHYVQNFTDIDDKILNRARQEGRDWQEITAQFIRAYQEDMQRLNILPADVYPRATESIPAMLDLIQSLIQAGYAYPVNGDVYYAVERFPSYGKLSGRQLEQMAAGASGRVDETEIRKRHPLDFALWKAAKPGEPAWDAPWGPGRPGWHIECSAMVEQTLGREIDLHTGGMDLIFPHHENEIAQSEAVSTPRLARYWMHNGFVNIAGEKMSKSLGNFTTIRALLDHELPVLGGAKLAPMALRLFVLQAHYRKPIDFTDAAIASAQNSWHTLQEGLVFGYHQGGKWGWEMEQPDWIQQPWQLDQNAVASFEAAMNDDFNTPNALVVLFDLAKELRREHNLLVHTGATAAQPEVLAAKWQTLIHLGDVLGLIDPVSLRATLGSPATAGGTPTTGWSDAEIEALIQQRQVARQARNFQESDRIRDQLKAEGITLIDQPGGVTRWHREE